MMSDLKGDFDYVSTELFLQIVYLMISLIFHMLMTRRQRESCMVTTQQT